MGTIALPFIRLSTLIEWHQEDVLFVACAVHLPRAEDIIIELHRNRVTQLAEPVQLPNQFFIFIQIEFDSSFTIILKIHRNSCVCITDMEMIICDLFIEKMRCVDFALQIFLTNVCDVVTVGRMCHSLDSYARCVIHQFTKNFQIPISSRF